MPAILAGRISYSVDALREIAIFDNYGENESRSDAIYSPRIINLRLQAALPALADILGKPYVPCPHRISTVDSRIHDLNKITECVSLENYNYRFTRELTPDENQFIINERTLCTVNYRYWASRYAFIKDLTGRIVRFEPNMAQRIFDDILAEMEDEGVELILQFLKARRLGISTECQLRLCHRLLFYPETEIVIFSDNPKKSDKLSKMLFRAFDKQPWWLRPSMPRFKRGHWYEFSNGNRIDIEHGSQEADIGRGDNPNLFHGSECAKIENPESLIDAGLMKAVIPNPYVFGVFEGTAEGDEGWWHDKYWFNKHNYGKPASGARMRPTFLPWYTGIEIYPSETWLRTNKWDASDYSPRLDTINMAKRAKDFVQANPFLAKHLGSGWEMPKEQMFFYEASVKEYRLNGNMHVWQQEMAEDDISAWQSRELSVFDAELRLAYRQSCPNPLKVYGIRKGGIPEKFWPSRKSIKRDTEGNEIVVKVISDLNPSLPALEFELVELNFRGYSDTDPFGKLFLWELPADGNTYAFGSDVADGLGHKESDNSTLEIFRKGSRWSLDAQVGEFVTPEMSGADLWMIGLAVGAFFTVQIDGRRKQPRCVPEINREGGKTFLKEMERRGWKNFHESIRHSATRRGTPTITRGWLTDPTNREELVSKGIQAMREEWIEINSPWLVSEMDTLIKHLSGKIGAAKHRHDDRLFALWMAYCSLYYDEARSTNKNPFQERLRVIPDEVKYPIYQNSLQSEDISRTKVIREP